MRDIEEAAAFPEYTGKHLKPISINGIHGLAACDENDPDAYFYKRVEVNRHIDRLHDHALHLAAENLKLREDAERWRYWKVNYDVGVLTSLFGNGCVNKTMANAEEVIDDMLRSLLDREASC